MSPGRWWAGLPASRGLRRLGSLRGLSGRSRLRVSLPRAGPRSRAERSGRTRGSCWHETAFLARLWDHAAAAGSWNEEGRSRCRIIAVRACWPWVPPASRCWSARSAALAQDASRLHRHRPRRPSPWLRGVDGTGGVGRADPRQRGLPGRRHRRRRSRTRPLHRQHGQPGLLPVVRRRGPGGLRVGRLRWLPAVRRGLRERHRVRHRRRRSASRRTRSTGSPSRPWASPSSPGEKDYRHPPRPGRVPPEARRARRLQRLVLRREPGASWRMVGNAHHRGDGPRRPQGVTPSAPRRAPRASTSSRTSSSPTPRSRPTGQRGRSQGAQERPARRPRRGPPHGLLHARCRSSTTSTRRRRRRPSSARSPSRRAGLLRHGPPEGQPADRVRQRGARGHQGERHLAGHLRHERSAR